ncbi:ubiquitin-conjugating enzyme E2 T-like isoform X4 [Schistocerca cancellata]|uniref:ubiquitin-conjugating enzyme E2 T-like isoform X4 n=1 Tax=Schistocerca cancellata TaxID=274614 RepID=UPI0021197790|nr:ubiquitin-conjugating enzyme E2 T-like isoform X4 [Schistocerca cancellata]
MQKASRLKRELELMVKSPPSGISCTLKDDNFNVLDASIVGLEGTAYEAGVFKLEIQIPEKYPFEPPQVKFLTPIYHPNIDSGGRICLDLLKVGKWKATITLSYLLMSIRLLLAEPNPSDPLVAEIMPHLSGWGHACFRCEKKVFENERCTMVETPSYLILSCTWIEVSTSSA